MVQNASRLKSPRTNQRSTLPLRGRAWELAAIDEHVARVLGGQGSVLLIEGPPGIGKTRLLAEVGARTVCHGGRSLSATAFEDQRAVPFAPLFSATIGADPPVGDAEALRRLGSTADLRYWVVHDLQSSIADAASIQPLSIAVDDVHLADAGTVTAVRLLMAGLADAPVLWALATRTGPAGAPIRDAIEAVASSGPDHASHLQLSAVDSDATADIVGDVLRSTVDDSLLHLAARADGNPYLILELLRGLQEDNRIRVTRGRASAIGRSLPRRLSATMDDRLDRLASSTRNVVEVAAVLPERFSVTLLARMLKRRPSELVIPVTEAIRADLLVDDADHLKFRHDLVRSAVRNTIPRALLRALERDSAAILLETGATPEQVATQMARSAEIGDVEAVESLRWAAQSLSRADCAGAADLSLRALGLVGAGDELRRSLLVETVDLLTRAARFDEAEDVASAPLSSDLPPQVEADIRLNLSIISSRWPSQRLAENRRICALPNVSRATRARNQAWLAHNLMLDGNCAAGAAARTALHQLSQSDDVETRTLAATTVASVEQADGYGRRSAAILDELRATAGAIGGGSPTGQRAAQVYATVLVAAGRLSEATAQIAEGRAAAEAERKTLAIRLLTVNQAMCDFAAGRLIAARTELEPMFRRRSVEYGRVGYFAVVAHLSVIAAQIDDRPLIRDTSVAACEALEAGPAAVRVLAGCGLAHAAWQRGELDRAALWLAEDLPLMCTPLWPVNLDYVVLTARVAAATRNPDVRRRAWAALELLEREDPGESLFTGMARHVRGLLEGDADDLIEAEAILRSCERPLSHAAAIEDWGRFLDEREHRQTATSRLTQAFDAYSAHGAVGDARRVARTLQKLGVTRRVVRPRATTGWESLTVSELRVVEIVGEGATNPEVAERLGVSPHTVNTHLRNAYAKLGINSRAELSRMVCGGGVR